MTSDTRLRYRDEASKVRSDAQADDRIMSHAIEARRRDPSIGTWSILPAAVTALCIAAIPLFPTGARVVQALPIFSVERVGFLVVAALLLVHVVRDPDSRFRLTPVEIAMAAFLVVIGLSWLSTLPTKDLVTIKQDADFLLTSFAMP